jgi:hypothetical protein
MMSDSCYLFDGEEFKMYLFTNCPEEYLHPLTLMFKYGWVSEDFEDVLHLLGYTGQFSEKAEGEPDAIIHINLYDFIDSERKALKYSLSLGKIANAKKTRKLRR